MNKFGNSGGLLGLGNILNPNTNTAVRYASSQLREAAKIGLQSLYANPEDVLERYKDFDIVKAMKERKGSKLLWVRARAIDADKTNTNGDYFSKEELLKETDYKGEKVPAYKTFEGVPIYSNHKNDDIEQAKGMVVFAEWDDDENCVYCTFFIDEEAYPDIARGVRQGYIHDVSMGCSVIEGECSVCGNLATTERDWCLHLQKYKGKKDPETGKHVFEKNRGIKFIELSVVGDGAFDSCEIQELFEPEDLLSFAEDLSKKASQIQANIALAASFEPKNLQEKYAYENCLRQISATTSTVVKTAQQAGSLVGGQILGVDAAQGNATIDNILKLLGINAQAGLSILDLINLALNFLEVAVMTLFGKKDNIDLVHVSKISKAMAELQTTMEDLIEDGVDRGVMPATGGAGVQNTPLNPQVPQGAQGGQGAAQAPPAAMGQQPPTAQTAGAPLGAQAPGVVPSIGFGGGFTEQLQRLTSTLHSLVNIKTALSKESSTQTNNLNTIGENIMSFMKEIKYSFDNDQNAYLAESPSGEKIVISSNGNVKAFVNNRVASVAPTLTDKDVDLIASGDLKTAATNVLRRFIKMANSDEFEGKSVVQQNNDLPKLEPKEFVQKRLENYRVYDEEEEPMATLEQRTRPLRENKYKGTVEQKLSKPSWNSRKGVENLTKEKLLEHAAGRGLDYEYIEEALEKQRVYGKTKAVENLEKVMTALASAAINKGYHPREIMSAAQHVASLGSDGLTLVKIIRAQNGNIPGAEGTPEMAVADSLTEQMDAPEGQSTAADLTESLNAALKTFSEAAMALENAVKAVLDSGDENVAPALEEPVPGVQDEVNSELAVGADAGPANVGDSDVKAVVSSVVNTVDQLRVSADQVINAIAPIHISEAHKLIELAKQPTLAEAREKNQARIDFYGYNRTASKKEILRTAIGHLADYAEAYNLRPKNLAAAMTSIVSVPGATKQLVAQALNEKRNIKTAGIQVKDLQLNEKIITLTQEDLGTYNIEDAQFQDVLREKVVEILQSTGYSVDPGTFSMNDVVVTPEGCIEVRVFTKFERAYDYDKTNEPATEFGGEGPMKGGIAEIAVMAPEVGMREAKKNQLIKKAQLGSVPGVPGAAAAPATPPMDSMMGGAESPVSAFTQDAPAPGEVPAPDEGVGEEVPETPGVKKPWGSLCPQCGSINVDMGDDGVNHCNDCQLQFTVEFIIKSFHPEQGAAQGPENTSTMEAPELGANPNEVGLGAATATEAGPPMAAGTTPPAPQGNMPGIPPMGTAAGTKAIVMTRISYATDPEVYLNANGSRFASKKGTPLPVGMICPACASRNVDKAEKASFCRDCQTLAPYETFNEDNKIYSVISFLS